MSSKGQTQTDSTLLGFGEQRMRIRLVQVRTGYKPWRVVVSVREAPKAKQVGGTVSADETLDEAREQYEWAISEALKKGWERGAKRLAAGGRKVKILASIPAPAPRPAAPASAEPAKGNGAKVDQAAPVASSRLLRRMDGQLGRRA